MTQTESWTLRQIELLHRNLREHQALNQAEEEALSILHQMQQQERDSLTQSQGSKALQIMLSVQQMSDRKGLKDTYLTQRQTLLSRHQEAEQRLQEEIGQEKIRQN